MKVSEGRVQDRKGNERVGQVSVKEGGSLEGVGNELWLESELRGNG